MSKSAFFKSEFNSFSSGGGRRALGKLCPAQLVCVEI